MDKDKYAESVKNLIGALELFEGYKPLTESQLEKLCFILDDFRQYGLSGGNQSLGMAYIEFCFINKLSDDEIHERINMFIEINQKTGQTPMTDEQMDFYIEFLNKGWEDVAITYFNFIVKGTVSLKYKKQNN